MVENQDIIFENKIQRKFEYPNFYKKVFYKKYRHLLHPKLEFLDKIDCELEYFPKEKLLVISYDKDEQTQKYKKIIISHTIDFVLEVINDFINTSENKYKYG
ncbi:MAG: hypothetical protein NZZ41_01630 [Candidatus Dojkabacteria bacterium]|nr:hypothetical protein [Candidatus Dojkabacteria bacterium]